MTGTVVESNPTARAVRCLQLVQDSPGITADRLARALGCSSRAARRYVAVLREAGIAVTSERGPYGGYRLASGTRLPPLTFSAPEALGLVMAVLDGHHDAADATAPAGAALAKLVRALPAPVAEQVQVMRRTTAPAADRGAVRPDPATTMVLVQACAQRRRVQMLYRSEAGTEWQSEVEPWSVVVRHGRWYLLCRSLTASAVRAYRVDRVVQAVELDASFAPPADLDPVASLEAHLGVGWEYAADVVVEAPVDRVRHWLSPALGRLEVVDERTTRLVGSTSNPFWYAAQLGALLCPFRVVAGPELRDTVQALGDRFVAAGDPVSAASGGRPAPPPPTPDAGREGPAPRRRRERSG